jgi:hypothetical protein
VKNDKKGKEYPVLMGAVMPHAPAFLRGETKDEGYDWLNGHAHRRTGVCATSYDFTSASHDTLAGHHCQMPRVMMRVKPAGMHAVRLTSTFRLIN